MSTGGISSTLSGILGTVNDAFSGKTFGIDVNSVVDELMQLNRQPEAQMQSQQSLINVQLSVLGSIGGQLSALQSSINSLKDPLGPLSQKSTGSSNAAIVSASADTTAAAGTHSVVVSSLASTSSSFSDSMSSGASLAGAEIDIKYGPDPNNPLSTDTILIPQSATTLQQAADSINGGGYGVTASVVSDSNGSRLVFTSKTSGANGSLNVSSSAANFTSAAGTDAQLTVDGVPVDSASNTVTGAIQGVTLSLGSSDPNTAVLISVQPDTAGASQAIQAFATAYNNVIASINNQFKVDSSGNEGVLAGDSMLTTLQSQLLGMVSTSVSGVGQYVNLQSMGIEMQNDGSMQINASALSSALSGSFADVQTFFQSTSPAGFGQAAGTIMQDMTDPTTGAVGVDVSGLNQTSQNLTNQINDFEVRMTGVQAQLMTQYSSLNTLLQQYPSTLQQVASQLASLPSSSNKG